MLKPMASLSLPRVLQLKKNSLDAEREQFEKFQTLAIQKAINAIETPVKEKHVRSTIIGTFQEQSAITYWMVAIRLPLQDNRIVAWKFCHVTHKLLREGHPACLDDSQRHIGMIENVGKLWVHLREGYGKLVHLYCNLLVCKLKFHARNPRFPGNMQLTADELDAIAENDVNNYFQLCVELFDYMDDILNLQAAVFDSLGNARANSMTASGQCRLAALIPCAQDSSQIYDCNVRLLFRLHAALPADTLSGHRERFRQQFKKLSSFYKHASSLQYYRNLLTLPELPSNPPNFLLQSDFGTYVTPVVSIPEPPPDEVDAVGALIDTSDTISQATTPDHLDAFDTRATPSPQPDPVVERDRLIDHLQNELRRMRTEVSERVEERNKILGRMREISSGMESQLQAVKNELEEEKKKTHILSVQTPEIKQKLVETEEKAKVTDEKFQKLKGAYTQLREEHIHLIRQKAEVDKLATSLRAAAAQHESAKSALQQQLNDRMKDMELLQQSSSSSEEIEAYKNELSNLRVELEQSRQKEIELETLRANMEALEIEHKTAKTEQEEKLNTLANELKETNEILNKIKLEKEEKETELLMVKQDLMGLREKSGDEYKRVCEEKEAALKQVAELTQQYQQEKEDQILYTNKFQAELENLQRKLIESETKYNQKSDELIAAINNKNSQIEDVINVKDIELEQALSKLQILQSEIELQRSTQEDKIQEQSVKIDELLEKIIELDEGKLKEQRDRDALQSQLNDALLKIELLETDIQKKSVSLCEYENMLDDIRATNEKMYQELETTKNEEIVKVKEDLLSTEEEKRHLELRINEKDKEIEILLLNNNDATVTLNKYKTELDEKIKEKTIEITLLNDKLKSVSDFKDEHIESLKKLVTDKDNQVIALNVEVTKYSENSKRLEEELNETRAELEICKNEYITLKEDFDHVVERSDTTVTFKNEEILKLKHLLSEKEQVFDDSLKEREESIEKLNTEKQLLLEEKENIEKNFNSTISNLKTEYDTLKLEKENEVDQLNILMKEQSAALNHEIGAKDEIISVTQKHIDSLKLQIEELEQSKQKEIEDYEQTISDKEKVNQTLVAKLETADNRRLNAESELQDLLQQNSVFEADIATLKIQLEETKKELEKQSTRLVTCAGEAALEVNQGALAAFEGTQDSNRAAAELAAKALEELAKLTQIKGNEESVAKAAILAAHNTSQLATYITEQSNISTNIELSEKMQGDCRTMLNATKQCLESLKKGVVEGASCVEARGCVLLAAQTVSAADRLGEGVSVDDELAGMDRAIEEAASQIEELLTASRASDSGLKLEVNSKILDACTTLMGAVKMLVQDSRTLQNELGDPKTRQKMYRKNPQWSEGLISASKAVVFAAKLLVSSADEAVGAAGRLEGVGAAAHEVAGSTAQLVAASRARAPPASAALARLTAASRAVAAATGALVAAVRAGAALRHDSEALDTSALTLTATRRLEMESKVRSLELESALDAERARLAALRKRHYQLAQQEENGNMTNGKQ